MFRFWVVSHENDRQRPYNNCHYFTNEDGTVKTFAEKQYADSFAEKSGGRAVQVFCHAFTDNGDGTLTVQIGPGEL